MARERSRSVRRAFVDTPPMPFSRRRRRRAEEVEEEKAEELATKGEQHEGALAPTQQDAEPTLGVEMADTSATSWSEGTWRNTWWSDGWKDYGSSSGDWWWTEAEGWQQGWKKEWRWNWEEEKWEKGWTRLRDWGEADWKDGWKEGWKEGYEKKDDATAEDAMAATEEQNATVADPAATAEADALEDVCEQMKKARMD